MKSTSTKAVIEFVIRGDVRGSELKDCRAVENYVYDWMSSTGVTVTDVSVTKRES